MAKADILRCIMDTDFRDTFISENRISEKELMAIISDGIEHACPSMLMI